MLRVRLRGSSYPPMTRTAPRVLQRHIRLGGRPSADRGELALPYAEVERTISGGHISAAGRRTESGSTVPLKHLSKIHEVWARGMGTHLREVESGFRYTPTTTFETFPFPWPLGQRVKAAQFVRAIEAAAPELNTLRQGWLNPPGQLTRILSCAPSSTSTTLAQLSSPRPTDDWTAQYWTLTAGPLTSRTKTFWRIYST